MDLKTFKKFSKLGYNINEIAECAVEFELDLKSIDYELFDSEDNLQTMLTEASNGKPLNPDYYDEEPTYDIYDKQWQLIECGLTLKEVETFITEAVKEAGSK
ncbi:hypothetical protein H0243_14520 [Staphylococcus sciuri]|uniref:hypothetical protein n=1 Tax=Mammaliicoccus sciuri TaxID=1296 RepID=UPI0018CB357D|nr:hypothetical protein [Mammaliicoccus sciuri]MBG9207006.1 hypothetical protein [Mammaliicoccus sciuri]